MNSPLPRLFRASACNLWIESFQWEFAHTHKNEIQRYWARRSTENPHFFDGRVHLLSKYSAKNEVFEGALFEVDFKSFLYWRDHGHRDQSIFDIFGSAVIRSREGAVILGRQRQGHINEGFFYLPGGLIDPRDVEADQKVNICASILREVAEETGLSLSDFELSTDFLVTVSGQQVSIAVELRSPLTGPELLHTIEKYLSNDPTSELEEVIAVSNEKDLEHLRIPLYASTLLKTLLKG